jgi:hypothetical protein
VRAALSEGLQAATPQRTLAERAFYESRSFRIHHTRPQAKSTFT